MKPKTFLNDPADAVDEYISGLLLQHPTRLRKLANHRVILHPSFATDNVNIEHPNLRQVSILSGGGSGHEPSHAGYISSSMLSGAILGGIFASPPVTSILAAIRAVTLPPSNGDGKGGGGKGCLLIVKNYTGDRLNFGIARELAIEKYGLQVEMCIVADDTAVPRSKGITGARGVAATVLVHKCAGGAAYQEKDLIEVTRIANSVASQVKSLGVALDAVTIPGATTMNDRIPSDMMEVGLGIHGEAGMRQCNVMTCDEIARTMCMSIRDYGKEMEDEDTEVIVPLYEPGCELLIMVNNLGGTSNFEMSLLTRSIVKHLEGNDNAKVTRILVGSYMTSFDMHGASVTIMPLTGWGDAIDVLSYIDSDTDALAWNKVDVWTTLDIVRPSDIEIDEVVVHEASALSSPLSSVLIDDFANVARATLTRCCLALIAAEPILTKYDTIVGDGDCGMTMERGSREILKRLDKIDGMLRLHHPSFLFADLADAMSSSMGGTSGILLELFFRKAGTYLQTRDITSITMAESFREGVSAISFYGGAKRGSRTMLDALLPSSLAILPSLATLADVRGAADAARMGADETSTMDIAEAGRSNYLSGEVLMGTPDPGAIAVAIVFEAMADNGTQEISKTLISSSDIAEKNEKDNSSTVYRPKASSLPTSIVRTIQLKEDDEIKSQGVVPTTVILQLFSDRIFFSVTQLAGKMGSLLVCNVEESIIDNSTTYHVSTLLGTGAARSSGGAEQESSLREVFVRRLAERIVSHTRKMAGIRERAILGGSEEGKGPIPPLVVGLGLRPISGKRLSFESFNAIVDASMDIYEEGWRIGHSGNMAGMEGPD